MAIDPHEMVSENADAWALGALDAEEARAIEAHVADCDACAAIADDARETAASLGFAVPLAAAPAELKARVIASANVLREIPSQRGGTATTRRWWSAAAAAVAVFAVGAVTWGVVAQRRMNDLQSENDGLVAAATSQTNELGTVHAEISMASAQNASLASQSDAMLDVVSQPDVKRVSLNGTSAEPQASGRYVWSATTKLGVLVARDLPQLGDGETYCLWIVYENAWVSGGLFEVDATGTGRLVVQDTDDDAGNGAFRGFAITAEPVASAGKAHSGPTLLSSNVN
jgi:anti-sigma-K factor RskA